MNSLPTNRGIVHIDSRYDPETGGFMAVLNPGPGTRFKPFTSPPVFSNHEDALRGGVRQLEMQLGHPVPPDMLARAGLL